MLMLILVNIMISYQNNKKLYQHQEDGIKFLLSRNGAILGDDMGLGKSMQSIIAALESGAKKILVVCPSSTKINWERD
jgi:SNF2 family DNA or RNA helicase